MSKIFFDYENLRGNCVERISGVISELNSIESYFSSMSIPYDYSRRSSLLNVKEKIQRCNSDLKEYRNWIVNSNQTLNDKIDSYADRANKLPINSVKRRNQKI